MSSDDSATRLKDAASLLIKGGTLTSEPCPKCGGVQVRFADKTSCVSCGNEQNMDSENVEQTRVAEKRDENVVTSLQSSAALVEKKIVSLVSEISAEGDASLQKQKADLLESYLRILEKIRSLSH
ncbi:MAG TPA: Sjogren's syndrome/scleroderma autoantigen 1 family protein [Nitrososphaera sp.]